ncbi:MAG TPA: CDP-glycerol glycerophosphotransferase family protein [Dermatophilaceae bacterium]|nr:CDP-glycerol glycerophosphotransferase family protein [Dermatophilaceae bacterium]
MPSLSVVVPIYDVSDYLVACLESLAAQTLDDLEVILVDDGSTDGSGQLADAFAAGRDDWATLHVENGGLGRARNIGLDRATADYVAFVDSDDLVPRDAYELMLHAVRESGSDMVCGGVLRFDGARTFPSPLHRRAIRGTRMRTHIREEPSLIFDTTAWNKIYRTAFLKEHALRFPEGVYYEDIPVTLPAHFLAASVDVLDDPVYLWRERQTAVQSITQRRSEKKNLVDRMAAVSAVDDFLTRTQDVGGKALHDRKVLTFDIPLFLDVLHEGDAEFQEEVLVQTRAYLRRVPALTLSGLAPLRRLQYHLIERDMLDELRELQDFYRSPANRYRFVRSGLRLFADLPFRTDPAKGIPADVYEVTRTQPLRTGIRDVWWQGGDLMVDGHAFISRVQEARALSSVRRFQLRRKDIKRGPRHVVQARRQHRPDLTATSGAPISYDAAGFVGRIPAHLLTLGEGERSAQFELVAQVAALSARRGSSVGNPDFGRGRHPRRAFVAPGELAVPGYEGRGFVITVRRTAAVLERVAEAGDTISFTVRWTGSPQEAMALYLRRTDSLHALLVPLGGDGNRATATVPADELEIRGTSLGDRTWKLALVPSDHDSSEEPSTVLDLAPDTEDTYLALRGRSIVVQQDDGRGAVLVDTRPGPVLSDFSFTDEGLLLSGVRNGMELAALVLSGGDGTNHVMPVSTSGEEWSLLVPATGSPGSPVLRWLAPGTWQLLVSTDDEGQRQRAVRVGSAAEDRLGETGLVEGVRIALRSTDRHELQLLVDASGDYADRGAFHRERARKYGYRLQRRLPVEDTVLFESWKGKQYSDNPRAVYEELVRQGDPRRRVWAVVDHSVEVPPGAEVVITGSRAYFRHLARARWLVTNDSMPTHYVKRKGTRYAQTWHGTPLKRIGFDIDNLQMANKNYLEQFGRDVAKWDALVSPNQFSSEILKRAFRYPGDILEIGYPRNDIFYQEEIRESRARAARERLGLPEGKRVILYAPTWRDNDFDAVGRYQFTMKLDLERMHRTFGADSVLLIRGHQLVKSEIDADLFGGFIRNVSAYPDISDLYLVADVLITDYSSVMFDFANTGRPMLFYTWDLESYRDNLRGFYFDFEQEAPGPLLTDSAEVVEALASLDDVTHAFSARYDAFRERFTALEDGRASARFIERFL